jgi:flagellar basal-body rod protein FlgF
MNVSLFQAAAGLNANARLQEMIAENLASSSIPGFKKQELSFAAIQGGLMAAPTSGPQAYALPRATPSTNFQQGELRTTGVNTDVALEGRGFFAVQLPDGNTAYTRDGEFHLDASGQIVTKQGYPVLADSGPIQLDMNNHTELSISSTGEISQGADAKGKLKVVDFNDPQLLTPVSSGYFLARNPALQSTEPAATTVRQGFVEGANTSPPAEMVKLIAAMRMYEANQRVVQAQDDRMAKTITELGHPN